VTDPFSRLSEARKQAALARDELDRGSPEWKYAQKAAADAESALVLLGGTEILEESNDVEP